MDWNWRLALYALTLVGYWSSHHYQGTEVKARGGIYDPSLFDSLFLEKNSYRMFNHNLDHNVAIERAMYSIQIIMVARERSRSKEDLIGTTG